MQAAPPSWRAATNRAPRAIRALVTWKLPLPTTPNTVSAPRPVSTAPTASLTSIAAARSGPFDQGERPARAARATGDLQLGEAVLVRPQHRGVAGERRVERVGRPGVGADGLHPEPDRRRLLRDPAG